MTKLFVYGTLKRGFINNGVLTEGGAKFVQEDRIPDHGVYSFWPVAGPATGTFLEGGARLRSKNVARLRGRPAMARRNTGRQRDRNRKPENITRTGARRPEGVVR